ncbi:MAG: tRNA (uridine(54)-C5)-methyltransferase TrmA [Cardiobacteriaceae bacterium]|nr:tRNA (uridine(54)-C5)-methyltransferase TrmA [Cardiobacteriaceae bacterium]
MIYSEELTSKAQFIQNLFSNFYCGDWEIFPSSPEHFRMRAEFRIWREGENIFYAMSPVGEKISAKNIILLDSFPVASLRINRAMPKLLEIIRSEQVLKNKLFQLEFLSTSTDDLLITLIYHRKLDDAWQNAAKKIEEKLNAAVIGRSRGEKIVLSRDFVREEFTVNNEKFSYLQYEQSFSQPNAEICREMLNWTQKQARNLAHLHHRDLLELYCGNGNFSLPMARVFRRVLATEISKTSVMALRQNVANNKITNIDLARLSAEELSEAFAGKREFKRLKEANINLHNYDFAAVLVDPPRAGVDKKTLEILKNFSYIFYISCNPQTLAENLRELTEHKIIAAAMFDQFPHTPHIETAVVLQLK